MSIKRFTIVLVCFVMMSVFLLPLVSAQDSSDEDQTLYVGAGQTYENIQDAIDAADTWDIIKVLNGTYNENVIINKEISLIGESKENTIINGTTSGDVISVEADGCQVYELTVIGGNDMYSSGIAIKSRHNYIENCIVTDNYYGISITGVQTDSLNNFIRFCIGYGNVEGIHLNNSIGTLIENSIMNGNSGNGINFYNSNNNYISDCFTNNNSQAGIYFDRSDGCWAERCVSNGNLLGLYSFHSNGGDVRNCNFSSNWRGIEVSSSTELTVKECVIKESRNYAINVNKGMNDTFDCQFFSNNIINNGNFDSQAFDESVNNTWDNGSVGNYWSEWTSPDVNMDGIVDNPYLIDGTTGSKDYLPMATPLILRVPDGNEQDNFPIEFNDYYNVPDEEFPEDNVSVNEDDEPVENEGFLNLIPGQRITFGIIFLLVFATSIILVFVVISRSRKQRKLKMEETILSQNQESMGRPSAIGDNEYELEEYLIETEKRILKGEKPSDFEYSTDELKTELKRRYQDGELSKKAYFHMKNSI